MSARFVEAAAWGSLLGCDGMGALTCRDEFERAVRLRVIHRAFELDLERMRYLAYEIAKALSGGR